MMAKVDEFLNWYRGDGQRRAAPVAQSEGHIKVRERLTDPSKYRPSQALRDAVNVAMMMNLPLLVSGEPGSGKTRLGYSIAHELGLEEPYYFVCKSTSEAGDLFYNYDAIRHFQHVQTGGEASAAPFIEVRALGRAIVDALPQQERSAFELLEAHSKEPRRSVVIVDEIDKAQTDFANDLLFEFETLRFSIPELQNYVSPPIEDHLRPILIITTNEQKMLPRAFLRRCVCVTIKAPRGDELLQMLESRFTDSLSVDSALAQDVVALFEAIRDDDALEDPPSVAELLEFIAAILAAGGKRDLRLAAQPLDVRPFIALLAKSDQDKTLMERKVAELG